MIKHVVVVVVVVVVVFIYWWCSGALAELDVMPGNEFPLY